MQRFEKILFVLNDFNKDQVSLQKAVELAEKNKASLKVIQVIKYIPAEVSQALGVASNDEAEKKLLHLEQSAVNEWLREQISEDVPWTSEILIGNPALEIVRCVLKEGHDLLIKTGEGATGFAEKILGSLDMQLIRKCPVPVWTVKPGPHQSYENILVAVDPDSHEETRDSLNDLILKLGLSFARQGHSQVHIAHAWNFSSEDMILSRSASALITEQQVQHSVRQVEEVHQKRLDETLKNHQLRGVKHKIHLLKGDAATVIPELAKREQIDLVVMGTVGRTGIPGFFIGNTAESILNQVECSVLTLKPEGFVSPVAAEAS